MKRLNEQFKIGDLVEIQFSHDEQKQWLQGRVVAYAAPGLWVQLTQGQRFFVTNTRRIRKQKE